jgi:hypothetical protein
MPEIKFTTTISNPTISQQNSLTEYALKTASISKQNVVKIVCNSPFRGEAISAYDETEPSTFIDGYNNVNESPYIVKQFDERGYVTAWGYLLRYVPGDTQQTFYIEIQEGNFSLKNGVIFNNKKAKNSVSVDGGKLFGYGSSIREITTLTNVYKLTAVYDEAGQYRYKWLGDGYSDAELEWDFGNFTGGNYLKFKQKSSTTNQNTSENDIDIATGKIIAVLVGASTSTVSVIVDFNKEINEFEYGAETDYYIEDINATTPCARYYVDVSEQLTKGSTIVQEITFGDDVTLDVNSTTYVPTVTSSSPSNRVYQYDWRFTRQIEDGAQIYEGIDPTQSAQGLIEGSVLGWFAYSKQLYVIISGSQFRIDCGTIYQRTSTSGTEYLGGNGIHSISEPIHGFFLNIKEEYTPDIKGAFIPSTSSYIVQNVDPTVIRGWYSDQQYSPGSIVVQYNEDDENDYISARVVKWIHPNSFGESLLTPSRLILEYPLIEAAKFNFMLNSGAYENKIVPLNQDRASWKYTLTNTVITGSGMIENTHYKYEQILNYDDYRGQLLNEGPSFYINGPRINNYGVALGTCGIRNITPTDKVGIYDVSLFSIEPNINFNIGDIKKYFNSLTYSSLYQTSILFEINTNSVEINYISVDKSVDGTLETGDIITTNLGSYGIINSIIRDSDGVLRKLIVKRSSTSSAITEDEIIQTYKRRGNIFNIADKLLTVTENIPLSNIFIENENSNGLLYPLERGYYFSKVKCPIDINYNKLIYSKFSGSSNTVTFQELQFGDLLFSPSNPNNYILYKTNDGSIKKIGSDSGLISYTNVNNVQTITIRKPSDIGASNFIFNGHFKGSLNANYRIKDLETKTNEYRRLIYDDISQIWYCYLTLSDIKDLLEVVKENADLTTSINLVDYFELDNGQRDDIYSFGKITLKSYKKKEFFDTLGLTESDYATIGVLRLKLSYTYYLHRRQNNNGLLYPTATASGPVIRESYVYGITAEQPTGIQIPLEEIGYYTIENKKYHLSSLLDFRPILKLENGVVLAEDENPLTANTEIDHLFSPTESIYGLQNTYYTSRIDNLYVNKDKQFIIQKGISSLSPVAPTIDSKYGMHIYTVYVPGYTINTKEIQYSKIENKRYTMRDIGKLETRINNLEYYTSLSLLEKEATDMVIKDADGNTRDKNGIIVDSFIGHSVGDVTNVDYNCSMDFSLGYLRPPFKTTKLKLRTNKQTEGTVVANFKETMSTNIENTFFIQNVGTGLYMLPFEQEIFIQQPLATQEQLLAPFDVVQYDGKIIIAPAVDDWVDITRKPDVTVNIDGNKDAWEKMVDILNNNNLAPWGTQWTEWKDVPGSRTTSILNRGHARGAGGVAQDLIKWDQTRTRLEGTKLVEKVETTDLGDKVVDFDIKHYTRPQTLDIYCTNFKPNTKFYAFYDGVNVEEFCSVVFSDLNRTGPITQADTERLVKFTDKENLPTGPRTDKNGNVHIKFTIPEGKFRTGDKLFVVTDSQKNDRYDDNTIMYGFATFSSSGLSMTKQRDIISVRSYDLAKDSVPVQEKRTQQQVRTWDPLAQTFFVDPIAYPDGIFLRSVDLCFADKDQNASVKVEIRPVVNGYPDSDKIYPNATSILPPSKVKALNELELLPNFDNADTVTTFTFDTPVYLAPGQHALVVRTDVTSYSTYVAEMGRNDIRTNQRVTQQPYQGVFFKSANASTWQADGNIDLMFRLNKCVFETGIKSHSFTVDTLNDFNNTFELDSSELTYELVNASVTYMDFNSCRLSLTSYLKNETTSSFDIIPVISKTDLYLKQPYKLTKSDFPDANTIGYRLILETNNQSKHVSPVIDLQQSGIFFIKNMIDTAELNASGTPKTELITSELLPKSILKAGTIAQTTPACVRYITKPVTLADEFTAKNVKVYLSTCLPSGTNIDVYIKAKPTLIKDNFNNNEYQKLQYTGSEFTSIDENDYREMVFELPEDISEFNQFAIKICLYSLNSAIVPKVKDMRGIVVL